MPRTFHFRTTILPQVGGGFSSEIFLIVLILGGNDQGHVGKNKGIPRQVYREIFMRNEERDRIILMINIKILTMIEK